MKTARGRLRWLLLLSSTLAGTTVFSQTTRVWTNQFPAHTAGFRDLATATNWSDYPSGTNGVHVPIVLSNKTVWYRLASAP